MKSVESDRFRYSFKIQDWHEKYFETARSKRLDDFLKKLEVEEGEWLVSI